MNSRAGPTWGVDQAFGELVKHEALISPVIDLNEATTRLRAIDTLLFDVLKWDKLQVEVEKYSRPGYADYAFIRDNSICLIIEAKKAGVPFLIPAREYSVAPFGFGLLAKECPDAADAMKQAQGYAASLGGRYIAITNGHQWILALTFVPSQPLDDRLIYVFESVGAIKSRFRHFWDCFSPEAIWGNRPAAQLLESRKAPAPPKLSTVIPNYPAPANRNIIVNELGYVLRIVWDRMARDENEEAFLRECYVRPQPQEETVEVVKQILQQRHSFDAAVDYDIDSTDKVKDVMKYYTPEKPIVVLGGVGHGKTTFLRYLRLVEGRKELENYMQLDVDFLDKPDRREDISGYCYREIDRQLLDRYQVDLTEDSFVRGVLNLHIERFRRSVVGKGYGKGSEAFIAREMEHIDEIRRSHHDYLSQVFRHLRKGRRISIAIFLDNLDRRNDEIQEEAFLAASAMARDWSCLVFVCLRPSTFYRSRRLGVLDAVAPKTVLVQPPKSAVVLRRRFHYAALVASGSEVSASPGDVPPSAAAPMERNVTMELPTCAAFLECCERSINKNGALVALLDAAANGNVRDLLGYTERILTSGHLDTRKILDRIGDNYIIPVHEALRALLYGDSLHYDPNRSLFVNVFETQRADPVEHFTRFLILSYLSVVSSHTAESGFCRCEDAVGYLCQIGYSGEHARDTLRYLYERRCIRGIVEGAAWEERGDRLRITTLGKYHVNELVHTFQYIDAIVIDTPILDGDVRRRVGDCVGISGRLDRAEVFLVYLNDCAGFIQDASAKELWSDTYVKVGIDIKWIRERVGESR